MTFIVGHNNKCHIYRSVGALKTRPGDLVMPDPIG